MLFTIKILKCTYVVDDNRTKYSTQGLGITRPARNNLEEFTTIFLMVLEKKRISFYRGLSFAEPRSSNW